MPLLTIIWHLVMERHIFYELSHPWTLISLVYHYTFWLAGLNPHQLLRGFLKLSSYWGPPWLWNPPWGMVSKAPGCLRCLPEPDRRRTSARGLACFLMVFYPLVMTNSLLLKMDHRNSGFTHWKYLKTVDLSIVLLVYQRVMASFSFSFWKKSNGTPHGIRRLAKNQVVEIPGAHSRHGWWREKDLGFHSKWQGGSERSRAARFWAQFSQNSHATNTSRLRTTFFFALGGPEFQTTMEIQSNTHSNYGSKIMAGDRANSLQTVAGEVAFSPSTSILATGRRTSE